MNTRPVPIDDPIASPRAKRRLTPFLFVFLVVLVWHFGSPVLAQVQPQVDLTGKNVLVIHYGEANVPIFVRTDKGLSTTLQSGGISDLNQFYESLNLRVNPGPEYRKALVEKIRLQYGHRKVDAIITMYPEALEFVLRDCKDILPDVPIVALYMQKSLELPKTDRTIVQHSAITDIAGTLEIALNLVSGVKRVYVVSGNHEVDKQVEEQARRDLKKWETRLEFHYLSHMPFEDMMATVSKAPPGSIVLLLVLSQDVKGARYTVPTVAQRLSQVSSAPIFGIIDTCLGFGIVGGSLLDSERIGSKTGELVLDFLRGIKPPGDASETLNLPPVPMFDWRQLRHWNLNVNAVPKGSAIINREYSLWDYRYYIIGGIVILLAQTALVIGLLVQRRRKNLAEESLLKKTEELDQRLRFEGLVSNLSASFVNLHSREIDSQIDKGLRDINEFFEADRISIGLFSDDGTQLARAFEYRSGETVPAPELLSKEQVPWYMDQLHQGKPVVINRVEDLPPEAEKERQFCRARGIESLLSTPIIIGGKTFGSCALVFTHTVRVWPEELVRRFRLISEVFANALERKHAEEASRESERILKQNESDLRRLAGRLIRAHEEERSRLARELHDDLAQRLAVFAIDIGKLEQQLKDQPAVLQEELREMKSDIVKVSEDVHNLSRQLHPSILDDLGLIRAIESECTNFSRREGIEIVFRHEDFPMAIPKDISLPLYRIIQEGLRNISKHACAEHISVFLEGTDHDVLLSIQDDGIGFDWAEVSKQPGLGLSSMRERARLMNGELSIQSQPEKGTVISIKVPLARRKE